MAEYKESLRRIMIQKRIFEDEYANPAEGLDEPTDAEIVAAAIYGLSVTLHSALGTINETLNTVANRMDGANEDVMRTVNETLDRLDDKVLNMSGEGFGSLAEMRAFRGGASFVIDCLTDATRRFGESLFKND